MNKNILQQYVHLSANYGSVESDYLPTLKAGENHLMKDYLYVNQPVKEHISKKGEVKYKRKINESK